MDVVAGWGVHYLSGPARLGPYPGETRDLFPGARPRQHYAGKLIEHDGATWLLTWLMEDEHGAFVGELGDPMPPPRFA